MSFQIELHADQDGRLLCPDCGGTLVATVVVHHYRCLLTYVGQSGAYLDDQVDVDTFEDDYSESDLAALTCPGCTFRVTDLGAVVIIPPPAFSKQLTGEAAAGLLADVAAVVPEMSGVDGGEADPVHYRHPDDPDAKTLCGRPLAEDTTLSADPDRVTCDSCRFYAQRGYDLYGNTVEVPGQAVGSSPGSSTPGSTSLPLSDVKDVITDEDEYERWELHLLTGPVQGKSFRRALKEITRPGTLRLALERLDGAFPQRRAKIERRLAKLEPKPAGDPGLAKRFKRMAGRMQPDVNERLRPSSNEHWRDEGVRFQRIQAALYALAQAHEEGTVSPLLAGVKTKRAVKALVWRERENYDRSPAPVLEKAGISKETWAQARQQLWALAGLTLPEAEEAPA